jgi:hypothetical protein
VSGAAVRRIAWAVGLVAAVELAGREIARRSLLHLVIGGGASIGALVVVALIACAIAIAAARGRSAAGPILTVCFALGIALQLQLGARLQSDGFYYFAYLRSIAFDHDVNFLNDYRLLGLGDKPYLFKPTRTGHAESAWTIGPAIVWSPFFAVGHLVAVRLRASGADVAADGTSYPYRQAVCVASLAYGLLGCWFVYRLVLRFFAARVAASAAALAVIGTFMLWYLVKEPSMTHAASMAAAAGFTWLWASTQHHRSLRQWMALGLVIGFAALIRWQNILLALLPGIDAAVAVVGALRRKDNGMVRMTLAGGAAFLVCACLAFLPQAIAWHAIYGTWIARSPIGPQIRWFDPHLADILWSARNGLFSTTPLAYLGAFGLLAFAAARPSVGLPAVATVVVMVYFNACIQDWWGSDGFGGRRFDGIVPLLAIGLAACLEYGAALVRRHAAAAVTLALACLAVWNVALAGAAQGGAFRLGQTLPFDRVWGAQAQVVHRWFGNPFTYPASLLFALRNGVGPGDYDLLSTNRFLSDPLQPYGRVDVGADGDDWLLGDGWFAPERDGAATYRWASTPAMLRLPLDHAAPLRVQTRLHAFVYPGAPAQTLTIVVNAHACGPLAVPAQWETVECLIDRSAWRAGVNDLSLQFGYAQRPADAGLGGDQRALAAAIDWIRVSIAADGTGR